MRAWRWRGSCWAPAGPAARAEIEAALARALELARDTGAKAFEPLVHVELAELARQSGDEEGRERELREAHRLFTEIGATGHAERLGAGSAGAGPYFVSTTYRLVACEGARHRPARMRRPRNFIGAPGRPSSSAARPQPIGFACRIPKPAARHFATSESAV